MPSAFRQLVSLAIPARLIVLALAAYGLASASPLTPPPASAPPPAGYVVSGIHYAVNSSDPTLFDQVTFQLTPSPRLATVRVKLIAASNSYVPCSNQPAGSNTWACALQGSKLVTADLLTIDVTQQPAPPLKVWIPIVRSEQSRLFGPIVGR